MNLQYGNRVYKYASLKSNPDMRVIFELKKGSWVKIFEGDKEQGIKTLKHLKKLSEQREYRKMVADINGTSYRAAKEDMGL